MIQKILNFLIVYINQNKRFQYIFETCQVDIFN